MGFAVYLGLLENAVAETPHVDVLVMDRGGDAPALARYAAGLRRRGLSVRVDRALPEDMTYDKLVRFGKEGPEDE